METDSFETWQEFASCRKDPHDPDWWFEEEDRAIKNRAKEICRRCPVLENCLEYAVKHRIPYGIWGGMTHPTRSRYYRELKKEIDFEVTNEIIVDSRSVTRSCGSKVWFADAPPRNARRRVKEPQI